MKLTHLRHSCLLLESMGQRVLIDPGTFSDLDAVRDLTAVVITHQHPDHCDPDRLPGLLQDNPQARLLVEPQTADALSGRGLGARTEALGTGDLVDLGGLRLTAVGSQHAVIHPYVDRIGNLGMVFRPAQGPSVFHPGDALDADPGPVDLLCVPLSAPWAKIAETIAFVRRVAPDRAVIPIHDALLSEPGRAMYLSHVGSVGADGGVEVLDLRGRGAQPV
jgi:L-ascorbate metabolism protein UlaG (beta-lactamase superfamily)